MDEFVENPFVGGDEFTADVVQFLRPSGYKSYVTTRLNSRVYPMYQDMLKHNCRFEAEILRTDQVSLTISNRSQDLDIEVVPNGPEVQQAFEKLLDRQLWKLVADDLDKDGNPENDPEDER